MLTWRDATRADIPAIEQVWDRHEAMIREMAPTVKVDRPKLFMPEGQEGPWGICQPPVIRVRVAEQDGVIIAFRKVELVPEVELIGADQEAVKTLGKELPEECQWARNWGFRSGWGLVPKELAKPIERSLRHTPLRAWPNLTLIGCSFDELGD